MKTRRAPSDADWQLVRRQQLADLQVLFAHLDEVFANFRNAATESEARRWLRLFEAIERTCANVQEKILATAKLERGSRTRSMRKQALYEQVRSHYEALCREGKKRQAASLTAEEFHLDASRIRAIVRAPKI